ncbi:hypothetical protein JCM10207_002123 [Rhodosporidiobolus poonsookiae]
MKPLAPAAAPIGLDAPSHPGLAFSLSKLLADRMAAAKRLPGAGSAAGGGGAGKGAAGKKKEERTAFMVTRCPAATMARLDGEDGCFCGKLESEATTCHGYDENDRRAVCVEDLRRDSDRIAQLEGRVFPRGTKVERSKRRRATCGLEFLSGMEPPERECPPGYARIGDPDDDDGPFICQDTASPYSCGPAQRDCYAQPGVLHAECTAGLCEIAMCQEGWRFQVVYGEDDAEGHAERVASCVPSKPLFFNAPS